MVEYIGSYASIAFGALIYGLMFVRIAQGKHTPRGTAGAALLGTSCVLLGVWLVQGGLIFWLGMAALFPGLFLLVRDRQRRAAKA